LKARAVVIVLLAAFTVLLLVGLRFAETGDIYSTGRYL
jgi:hypothetical protein